MWFIVIPKKLFLVRWGGPIWELDSQEFCNDSWSQMATFVIELLCKCVLKAMLKHFVLMSTYESTNKKRYQNDLRLDFIKK